VWGATALVALFLITLPAVAAHVAFPVQLQISRVFWLVDCRRHRALVGALPTAWLVRAGPAGACRVPDALAAGAAATSCSSSIRSGRSSDLRLADTPWHQAMRFVASLPKDAHVLADSGTPGATARACASAAAATSSSKRPRTRRCHLLARRRRARVERCGSALSATAPGADEATLGERNGLTHVSPGSPAARGSRTAVPRLRAAAPLVRRRARRR
jgi:hypothetical protein